MNRDLQPILTPRLAGRSLQAFTVLAELPLIGTLLRRSMLTAAGVPALRRVAVDDAPLVAPPLPRESDVAPPAREAALDNGDVVAPALLTPAPDSALALMSAYRDGTMSPTALAERFLDHVAASDRATPPLRAFIAVDGDDVRRQAKASAERHAQGRAVGPLDGVPVAVKDELDQVPYRTTVGTRFLGDHPASADATVVARLRRAGAVLIGKTNMHEVGLGVTGINPHHGTPCNPHDPERITGGSSSGSAAAVAAGLCPIALSADAGGSIRIPAALCGLVGLKPTFGRVSERGAATLCWSLAHIGVIGLTAHDVAIAYEAMAGHDPADRSTHAQPAPRPAELNDHISLRGLSIGIDRAWLEQADIAIVQACRDMLAALGELGVELREISIPDRDLVRPVHQVTAAVEWSAALAHHYREHRRAFGLDARLILLLARALEPTDYLHAQRLRRRICNHFADALRQVDLILTPTTPQTAPAIPPDALAHGESDLAGLERLTRFILPANVTGLPAISLPAGYDQRNLPIGMQLIARPWHEHVLLRVAHAAQPLVPRRIPQVRYTLLPAQRQTADHATTTHAPSR